MGFDNEEEIHAFQKKLDEEDSEGADSREGGASGDEYGDEEGGQLLDLEKIKQREGLTDK